MDFAHGVPFDVRDDCQGPGSPVPSCGASRPAQRRQFDAVFARVLSFSSQKTPLLALLNGHVAGVTR